MVKVYLLLHWIHLYTRIVYILFFLLFQCLFLLFQAYFTTTGNLTVEVIMANDIVKPKNYHEPTPVLPLMSSGKSPDTYVQVKLVPGEWFPNVRNQKTKIQKKSEAPVYKESFEL